MSAQPAIATREWPDDGCSRVPNWIYTDPQIFARELDRIFGATDWLYVCLEAEIPNPGDFKRSQLGNRDVVAVRGTRWRGQRAGQSLRASQHAGLHREPRFGEGVRLPLSPMDLRSRRQPARRAVPPRLSRPGRHAGRFPPEEHGLRRLAVTHRQRRGVRQLRRAERIVGDLSRRPHAGLFRPRVRWPRPGGARLHAPAHSQQLEADVREHQGPLPRQPAARVPGHLRSVPPRSAIGGRNGRDRPPRGAGQPSRRAGEPTRRPRRCVPSSATSRCAIRACWTRCASSPATPPWCCRRCGPT